MKEQNNDKELQQLLREKLEEHTVPAPDFVWPAIEKELFPPAQKRRPFFWWFIFSGVFLGTLFVFFLYQTKGTSISSGMSAVAIHTSLQPATKTISTHENQSSSTAQLPSNEKNLTVTSASENDEHVTQKSAKNESSFKKSDQPGTQSKTYVNSSSSSKQKTKRPSAQKSPTNDVAIPVTAIPAHASLGMGVLMGKTIGDFAAIKPIAGLTQPDSNRVFTMNTLSPKTLSFLPDTVGRINPILPLSEQFAKFSFIDIYFGAGRNRRTYSGMIETNSNAVIVDRTLQLKNTNFGIDYNYQFLPFASVRIGVNMGANRYITRLFPIRIANTELNNELEISSPGGDLKSAPLELDDQASSISDTTTFLMRIVHRSRYFAVPLSIRFNTTNAKGPQLYGYTGFDFVFRGNDQNTLIVRKSQFERSYSTSNARGARGFYSGWHLGVGLASNASRKVQLFSEFNYSQVFGNYYTGKIISIRSNNVQLNLGLRINL